MSIDRLLERVRAQSPLVHHITNWVTISDCAQIAKTLGASPVMAHAADEVAEMAALASAVVLNIGTLTGRTVASMKQAARAARRKPIPVVLDVCGAGATALRNRMTADLLETGAISIIKGNASEIAAVAGAQATTKGVDSGTVTGDLEALARDLARAQKACVVVTGAVDIVTDGARLLHVGNGHPMMAAVVGTGCMAATVIGTFAAVESDPVEAACAGLAVYEIAAEIAAEGAKGPMAFKAALFDTLYGLDGDTVAARAKVTS